MSEETLPIPEWVLVERFCELTGYTDEAVKIKRKRGIWPDGIITKIQGGRVHVNLPAYDRWVATGRIAA